MSAPILADPATPETLRETVLEFPDNRLLIDLCGEYDRNLAEIEKRLLVSLVGMDQCEL